MLGLLRVPGFGPKHAGQVYRELGIASVEELEVAARSERLRELKGWGAKSEEKVLRSIALYHEGQARVLLGVALPLAQELVARLRAHPGVLAAEMAGSVRRCRETIGDLDLLSTSDDAAAVCGWFASGEAGPAGKGIIAAGDTKVSVRIPPGLNVDLRCVPAESYGAALLYFTGSKQHNIDLRERALTRGLTLNEYGLFHEVDGVRGERVAGASEEEVYEALGLAWIPPELREARGEIAAAEAGTLPALVTLDQIRCDLQMHTVGSDGRQTVAEMALACHALGYTHLGISDHSPALGVAGGQKEDELAAQIEAIHALNAELATQGVGLTILAGIEADILGDGRLDIPGELFDALDYVIGSIHQGFTRDADRITGRILEALASGRMDILAHPTGRLLLEREPYGIHMERVIEAAVAHDVALEINASPHRLDLSDIHARLAQEWGAKLTINTDAHRAEQLALMPYGVMTARRGWVRAETVINTWSRDELRGWLARRRGK
jgi:DNA polymerase (family 10)